MVEQVETIIVGGGQAGLTMSHWLSQSGQEHLILERGRIVERWRSERWDSLCILTPNWTISLPAYRYSGPEPDAFMGRDEIVAFMDGYAAMVQPPVRTGVTVTSLQASEGGAGYRLETTDGAMEARNVVVATGPFGDSAVPSWSSTVPPGIMQLHSNAYRNPAQLPPGAVLVVGSGASGFQITEDLQEAGRKVYFSVGRHETRYRRYRGQDSAYWMNNLGQWERKLEDNPQAKFAPRGSLTGAGGGHDLIIRKMAHDGATLLGRIQGVDGQRLAIAPDVADTVLDADSRIARTLGMIDECILRNGLDAPPEPPRHQWSDPPELIDPIRELDLRVAGITSIIWATGFRYAFEWIQLPIFDEHGEPCHLRGVTTSPGLYFLGLRWQYKFKSSFIHGVGDDAEYLADQIVARSAEPVFGRSG